ncbi:MAG TPA: RING finger protein [Promineifilum sp.]|nr:RING finger protein [Promineifilum sp.]
MDEQEHPPIRITEHDISEANQLSLSCPICGNAVENNTDGEALVPVVCDKCGTLYHRACWEGSGGKCAVLGCGSVKFHIYGKDTRPVLKVKYTDLPASSANGRAVPSPQTRRLKEEQRRQVQRMTLFQRFWKWLLDQIRINP